MNQLGERQPVRKKEIEIIVHMISGDVFSQPLTNEEIDHAQEFIDWYRKPGKSKVWSWHCIADQTIYLFKHDQIGAIDIKGYIEPDGRSSRWYERIYDRFMTRRIIKGGD